MKKCPQCAREYDASMSFCLDDGSELLYGPASMDEPATALISPHETEPATRTFDSQMSQVAQPTKPAIAVSLRKPVIAAVAAVVVLVAVAFGVYLWIARGNGGSQINSIAVMPFVNASGNPDIEYLSDGVTESLINNLSQLASLSVKGRSSVFRYKGKDVEPQQVAADLKVQAVLNGRVAQRGDSVTISLDLVDGATGDQIWGEQYTRKAGDFAALQSEIARDVSQKLRARLTGAEETRVVKNQTQNSEAYQLYLQGRYNWNKRTDPTTKKAIEYFRQATEKDPNYAMAYVGLAESYLLSHDLPADETFPRVKAAALKALEIDPTLGEPHAALAAYYDSERESGTAEQEYRRAIELSPNYATAYHWYGELLSEHGRFDEALPVWKKALELDPFSLAIGTDYALEYLYYSRKYEEAADHLRKLIEIDPNYVRTHGYLSTIYRTMGRYEDSISEKEKEVALQGMNPEEIAKGKRALLDAFRLGGPRGYWLKILEFQQMDIKKGDKVSAIDMAEVYAQLDERDLAFKWLESAHQSKNVDLNWSKVEPKWDPIRDDPRFADLLRRLKLS